MSLGTSRTLAPLDGAAAVVFEAVHGRRVVAGGERRLLLAVLEDGIRTALRHAAAQRGRGLRLHREAVLWLTSDARADPFTFVRICEALDIDAGRLRNRVVASLRDAANGACRDP